MDTSDDRTVLPVVEPSGLVTAQASRAWCHGGSKLLHPVVHLHIINRSGEVYLQQRGAHKDLLPLRWDTAVGGHVSYGEYIEEALYREAAEELHFFDFNPVWLTAYQFESESERELVNVFAASMCSPQWAISASGPTRRSSAAVATGKMPNSWKRTETAS